MSGTTSPTAARVDAAGISAPGFVDIQQYLIAEMQAIYGNDIVVTPDSQDGQLLSIFALALADANAACIAAYNAFSPATAQGAGLSSVVKLNGLVRASASHSTALLSIIGQAETVILNGGAMDVASNRWLLPPSVQIPVGGQITVAARCVTPGAITALPHTITRPSPVTRGWQSVTNPAAALPGLPVETDAALRVRQSYSTALPAQTVFAALIGAVMGLENVVSVRGYENDTNAASAVGLPPHSIALVVIGGDPDAICETILARKTPGCFTFGTTRRIVNDVWGLPHDIGYFIPTDVPIGVMIVLEALTGFTTIVRAAIQQSVADYINALGSGESVFYSRLFLPANLYGQGADAATFDIRTLELGDPNGPYSTANRVLTIFERATCDPNDVVIVVV